MSVSRKRRSSDSLEGDRKRISFDRNDCGSYIKQEYNNNDAQSMGKRNNGRSQYGAAVPYDYVASTVAAGIQSAIVSSKPSSAPQRHYYSQTVAAPNHYDGGGGVRSSDGNHIISSIRNYYSIGYNDALSAAYDNRRQLNFKHEVYINSLRQSEPRIVNFNDLRRHLSDIDLRFIFNWKFSTALDLTLELESSLKYFVDTRNELVFLRKLQHTQCIPFAYNEINISNRHGLYNRIRFLEDESAYRSNRMNQLFNQLQSVVIPSIIDDIRYVHSVSYEKCWANRARYWFTLFKQIKYEHRSTTRTGGGKKYQQQSTKHRRSHRNSCTIKDEVDVLNNANIKSESTKAFDAKDIKVESNPQVKSSSSSRQQEPITILSTETMSNIVDIVHAPSPITTTTITSSSDCNNAAEKVETPNENDDLSNSLVIVEPNVSVVSVTDDDDGQQRQDGGQNPCDNNPPVGDPKN